MTHSPHPSPLTPHPSLYLDHNATTPLAPHVKAAMNELLGEPLNPSSLHSFGRKARQIVENARNAVRTALNANDYRVVFTGSGTEANNLLLHCTNFKRVLISAVEHSSITKVRADAEIIPVDENGIVQLDALELMLSVSKEPTLVSIMLANNETGVIQPLGKIIELAHSYKAIVHSDLVQALGKIPLHMEQWKLDAATIAAHKIGGPQGIGALIIRDEIPFPAQIFGGGQERGYRAGTENVAAIHGFAAALEKISERIAQQQHHVQTLRDTLEEKIIALGGEVFAKETARLGNTSSLCMPGVSSEAQLIHFDLEQIAVSAGSACSSGKISASHVLLAMGVSEEKAKTVIRVSLGIETTEADISRFITAWEKLKQRG